MKKLISLLLSIVMLVTSCCVAFYAYAVDDFAKGYTLEIYHYDDQGDFVPVTEQLKVMEQYDIPLYACLVYDDGTVWNTTLSGMPVALEGYTVDWVSDARYLAFCEKNDGVIHGYDATKGEAIRNWLDSEVATIPLVGGLLKNAILALLDNGINDIDDLDTADVVRILRLALATVNIGDEAKERLINSVADYLDRFDVGISAVMKDPDGNVIAKDTVRVLVTKSSRLLSDVIPNAAFIKNYDSIPRKVAVGYEIDLEGIITPVRTHYSCEWTVTGQAGILGSDLAEVDSKGHFTAKSPGTVQVKVSPDIKGLTRSLRLAFDALAKAGDLVDSESIAKGILLILGIKEGTENYDTLIRIITAILNGTDVSEDGVFNFTDETMAPLANFILYIIYQDAITIEIVDTNAIDIESYDLSFENNLTEGDSTTLKFTNVKPEGAVPHDYTFSIDNEEYAVFTDDMTVLGIDGSTWANNYLSANKTSINCTMDGKTKKYNLNVYGRANKSIVYIKIGCKEELDLNVPTPVNAETYPKRLTPSLKYGWVNEDGTYNFATDDAPAVTEDGNAYVTSAGIIYGSDCTVGELVVQDKDGATQTKTIASGVQTESINFTKNHFWTKGETGTISTGIRGAVCEISAYLLPVDASFNKMTFISKDTESVILSPTPLTTAQYTSAALTEQRRAAHASVTVTANDDGYATVYAYAIGNNACFSDVVVKSQTGGFIDNATVAYANLTVDNVEITAFEDDYYLVGENQYTVPAGKEINFESHVRFAENGNWKNQGFDQVEWFVSNDFLGNISSAGRFIGKDIGTVTVRATSVYGEVDGEVSVQVLADYTALNKAMEDCDYSNLNPDDWSVASWNTFDTFYKEAQAKLAANDFESQLEVDALAENIIDSFNALVKYRPLTGIELSCENDADGNGFATVLVSTFQNYTNYSTTIKPIVFPQDAEDYTVTYTSSDDSKIRVTDEGVCGPVEASEAAWAKITVKVTDPKNGNEFTKDMYVAFAKNPVASVSLNPNTINFVGFADDAETPSTQIAATYRTSSNTNANIRSGFFESSDDSVATVDSETGEVVPVGVGSCTIICYSYDGGYTATTNVTVTTNKKNLKSAIDEANSIVKVFYTEESYAAVMTALDDANIIYNNEDASQQDINSATAALNNAIESLEHSPFVQVYLTASTGGSILYNGNTYTGEDNSVIVDAESGLTVTAVDDEGYHFTRWTDEEGNTISTNQTETFTIESILHFKAEFEEIHSVTGIKLLADGSDADYHTVTVNAFANYTRQSSQLSYEVYPSDANFYTVEYKTDSTTVVIDEDGKVTPAENDTCYAIIDAVVTNTVTGEQFTDTVTVSFVKYKLASVTASPNVYEFEGINAETQTIEIQYSASSSLQNPSLRQGFFVSDNEDIARVDSNGVITPVGIGSCTITFTAYDGGLTTTATVNVHADKSALRTAISDADDIVARNYTAESYEAMMSVRDSAVSVESEPFASQTAVDDITSALEQAINSLEKLELIDYIVGIEGSGSVTLDKTTIKESGSFAVKSDSTITFVAAPDEGNEFIGWFDMEGNLISSDLSYTTVAAGDTNVTAKFATLVYIESIEMTYDDNVGDFAQKDVSTTKLYTSYYFDLGVQLNPSNPSHYNYNFTIDPEAVNLKLDGTHITPASNSFAYGRVYVNVVDELTGKVFTDSIMVSFANYTVVGVDLDKSLVEFSGVSAPAQSVGVKYTADSRTANIQLGYVTVEDESVATASMSSGTAIVVEPKAIGSTKATFTAIDGGLTATFDINVYADKSALSEALSNAKELKEGDYTPETFASLAPVIEYAQSVYDEAYISQKDVDDATADINSVIASLVLRSEIELKAAAVGQGYVTINGEQISSIQVERGNHVEIVAVPDEDYMLDSWYDENGNVISHDAILSFDAANAGTYIAIFKAIPYITNVVATYDGYETDFASIKVGTLARYTASSASFSVNVYPEDADYEVVGYSLGTPSNNLSISGSTVKPAANNPAYGQVIVTVRDKYTNKEYTDAIYVSFAKTNVSSVAVDPTEITFDSVSDSPVTITPSYSASGANIKDGFFVSSDESVATVDAGVVTPVGKGECDITFYSYDGGKTATTKIIVMDGGVDVYGKVVAMNGPMDDNGDVAIAGATVTIAGKTATTDENGEFVIHELGGNKTYSATVEYEYGVTRTVSIAVGTEDKHAAAIPVIAVDYDKNGYINARDYLEMKKLGIDNKSMFDAFFGATNYTSSSYIDKTV